MSDIDQWATAADIKELAENMAGRIEELEEENKRLREELRI